MQSTLENALDKLISPRSSIACQKDALTTLERTLAELILVEKRHLIIEDEIAQFLQLQDSFQCNFASRILLWLAYQSESLMKLGDRKTTCSSNGGEEESDATSLVVQALSILQGVALMHKPSKDFLCRKSSIEVFVDILSICRHASAKPFANLSNASPTKSTSFDYPWDPSLVSAVLDSLLCVLVDSPPALRCFEEARGIEHVVKILKRPAIPKDIKIKCLEFLYFYLMDESMPLLATVPTRPSSPSKHSKTFSYDRSRLSTVSNRSSNSSGSHSTSSSFSSWSASPTLAGTPPSSPKKSASNGLPRTHDTLNMLRRDVDFVPQSPKRAKVAQLDGRNRRPGTPQASPLKFPQASGRPVHKQLSALSRLASEETLFAKPDDNFSICEDGSVGNGGSYSMRTTQEKKEILGQLLGNVDALVEGVKKAGIWGLGE